jgi:hypothetical protein
VLPLSLRRCRAFAQAGRTFFLQKTCVQQAIIANCESTCMHAEMQVQVLVPMREKRTQSFSSARDVYSTSFNLLSARMHAGRHVSNGGGSGRGPSTTREVQQAIKLQSHAHFPDG